MTKNELEQKQGQQQGQHVQMMGRHEVQMFFCRLQQDRVGIVVFSDKSIIALCPDLNGSDNTCSISKDENGNMRQCYVSKPSE